MRRLPVLLTLVAVGLGACGGADPDARFRLTTPPEHVGAMPVATPTAAPTVAPTPTADGGTGPVKQASQRDVRRARSVIAAWARAVRTNHIGRAASYFSLPTYVQQQVAGTLRSRRAVRAFNDALPCGAQLLSVRPDGPYVVATFRMVERAGHTCDAPRALVRVAFRLKSNRFREWRQLPSTTAGSGP